MLDRISQIVEPLCLILADDLTGACDAAAPFASCGIPTEVPMVWDGPLGASVVAVNTNSRDISEAEAVVRVQAAIALRRLVMPTILFKKLDSLFRGNTFAEIGAIISLFPDRIAVLAPAFPAVGRRVRNGCLFLDDGDGPRLDISGTLRSRGIRHILLDAAGDAEEKRVLLRAAIAQGHRLILCDAESSSELKALALAGLSFDPDVLWIGSGGLAHALAHSLPETRNGISPEVPFARTLIYCVGTDHPATMQQVGHLRQTLEITDIRNSGGGPTATPARLPSRKHLLWETGGAQFSMDEVQALSQHLNESPAAALFLSGGDTAMRICNALNVRSISLRGELFPGVPWGVIQGGMADRVAVITKSGGFGKPDTLASIARMCSREGERRGKCI